MNCAFSSYIKEILENSKRLNSRYEFKVGDFFNENFCFNNTNLISENISYEILSGDFPCRELLQDSNSFSGNIFHPSTIHAFYWSFNKAIQIHWDTYTRVDRKEDVQNSGLFGTIALSLETIKYLTQDKGCFDKFSLYTADCVTDGSESELGSDFAFIIPCDEDTYKIALFQAKKADFDGSADVSRESPGESGIQQITRLLEVESDYIAPEEYSEENPLLYSMCYYTFWHDPNTSRLPTILSASQVNAQLIESTGVDFSIGRPEYNRKMAINAPLCGTWFGEAIPLLLADPSSCFGVCLTGDEIKELLRSPYKRPRTIYGARIPSQSLNLKDWHEIVPADCVRNEQFYRNGKIIKDRRTFTKSDPTPGNK